MSRCPALSAPLRPVDPNEAAQATVKLSGISKERFVAIDNLPPSELFITISTHDVDTGRDLIVACVAASWNSRLGDCSCNVEATRISFDPTNVYGAQATSTASFIQGSVLLIVRGECSLGDKALHAAAYGAKAVLVCDTVLGRSPGIMSAGTTELTIPGFMISMELGMELQEALQAGCGVFIRSAALRPATSFQRLGGEAPIRRLIAAFYRRVFAEPEAWFREIFQDRDEDIASESLANFMIERLGGPNYFALKKGPAALIARHMLFDIKPGSAKRWLTHMGMALVEVGSFDDASASVLMDYFQYQAHYIEYVHSASRLQEAGNAECLGSESTMYSQVDSAEDYS